MEACIMAKGYKKFDLQNLPASAAEFIKLVIKKMRYRKKVQADVQAELATHFEDELKECANDKERDGKVRRLIEDFGDVKLLAVLLRRAKKRCRPLWRTIVARAFQTVGVLILCFIVYCIYISVGKPTISVNYVEEMTRISRPVADESLNAAPLYQRAIDAYKEPPEIEREVKGPEIGRRGVEKVDLLVAIRHKDWIGDLTEEETSSLEQCLSSNAEAVRFFKQASRKPHCWWHREAKDNIVMYVLMPGLGGVRNTARLLCWQAKLKAFNGDIEGAFENLLVCYRAGSHFKGPRSLVEQLVGIAIQGIATRNALIILNNREIDGRLLKSFQDELEQLMAEDTYVMDYQTERFFALDFIQRCYTDDGKGSGHMSPRGLKKYSGVLGLAGFESGVYEGDVGDYGQFLGISLVSADRREMSRAFEQFYNNAQGWTTKTPWQLREENVDFEMGLADWSTLKKVRYWPVTFFMPALGKVSEVAYRNKVGVEAFVATVAILRYKQEHGNYPENLSELLEAGLLKELPMDPFSNEPVVYRKMDDDFMLYSVGLNFEDDGGQVVRDKRARVKKWADEGDEVFWPVDKY